MSFVFHSFNMLGNSRTLKSARLRGKQRKVVIGRIVTVIILACVYWGLAFWLSGMPQFTVQDIEAIGNSSVSSSEIASAAGTFLKGRYYLTIAKSNILFYPKRAIQKHLYDFYPRIEKVSIGLKDFHSMAISITERQPKALWCKTAVLNSSEIVAGEPVAAGPECFAFDKSGLIFASSTETSAGPSKFIKFFGKLSEENPIGRNFLSAIRLAALFKFSENIRAVGFEVAKFIERSDGAMEAALSDGGRLIFVDDTDLDMAVLNLQAIVGDPGLKASNIFDRLDYIDLRFGNKVYYKLKN